VAAEARACNDSGFTFMNANLLVILNFLFIFASILIFASPFYYFFKRQGHGSIRTHGLSREIEEFFQSRQANYLVFFWAMGEALFWFVIPEFLLLLVIFMRIKRKRELLIYDIFGTIAGTVLAFTINLPAYLIEKLPYIQPAMVQQCAAWFDKHGIFALMFQPFSGVPYKVFAYLAPNYHILIIVFVIAAVTVRIARYYIFYALFSTIYPVLHKYVYRNYAYLFVVAVFIFSLLLVKVYASYEHPNIMGMGGQETVLIRDARSG
jgi:hypothetical protein